MKSLINFLAGFIVALAIVTLWLKANIDAVLGNFIKSVGKKIIQPIHGL